MQPNPKIRIAVLGISCEVNTFAQYKTYYDDFQIYRNFDYLPDQVSTYAEQQQIELIPVYRARCTPSGIIDKSSYQRLKSELFEELAKLKSNFNGVLCVVHGATEIEDIGHGESDLLTSLRMTVGNHIPISCYLDLHGNIPPQMLRNVDFATALRTAPHRDFPETLIRALKLLLDKIRHNTTPQIAQISVPLLFCGERVITEIEPARSLYNLIPQINSLPGIIDSSVLVGFAWADRPYAGASVIVISEKDKLLAHTQAQFLAAEFWRRREEFRYHVETAYASEAIKQAHAATESCVFVSDSGDNITAGAEGSTAHVLIELYFQQVKSAFFGPWIRPDLYQRAEAAGVDGQVCHTLISPDSGKSLNITFKVTNFSELNGHKVCMLHSDGIDVALCPRRVSITDPEQIRSLGVEPLSKKIVVLKLGYLMPELSDIAPRSIIALTPGSSALQTEALTYRQVQRPIFPLDLQMQTLALSKGRR